MPKGSASVQNSTAGHERQRSTGRSLKSATPLAASTGSGNKSKNLSQLLSLRLSYARYKVEKGWSSSSLDEVEMLSSTGSSRPALQPRTAPERPATAPVAPADATLPAVQPSVAHPRKGMKGSPAEMYPRPHSTAAFRHSASSSRSSLSAATDINFMPLSSASSSSAASMSSSLQSAGPLYSSYASSIDMTPSYPQPSPFQYLDPAIPPTRHRPSSVADAAHQYATASRRHSYQQSLVPDAPPMVNSFSEPGGPHSAMNHPAAVMQDGRPHGAYWRSAEPWGGERYDWNQQRQLPPVAEYPQAYQSYAAPSPGMMSHSVHDYASQSGVRPSSGPLMHSAVQPAFSQTGGPPIDPATGTPYPMQAHDYQHGYHDHPSAVPSPYASPAPGSSFDMGSAAPTPDQAIWQYTNTPNPSTSNPRDSSSALLPPADIR